MELNKSAIELVAELLGNEERYRVRRHALAEGGTLLDLGVDTLGGLDAGLRLAEICLAGLADVSLVPGSVELGGMPSVAVRTDHPVAACLASQYAGWQIKVGEFFALGSGPMRAAAAREPLFKTIGHQESPSAVVGVVESNELPPTDVFAYLSEATGVEREAITLLVAPVTSLAGTVQVVARSVETALHKLHELRFDLGCVVAGFGTAPLPPAGGKWLSAMGRTNDAILYGGEVVLWVRGKDETFEEIGPRVPSCASADFGEPFQELFDRYECDFYKIDPLLFSPAVVTFLNLETGNTFRFGELSADIIEESFDGS